MHVHKKLRIWSVTGMKKLLPVILVMALISQVSCLGSIIKNSAKDTPLNNKFLLHSNARVGDYAILQGAKGNSQIEMKIIGRSAGLFVVRSKTGYVLPGIGVRNALTIDIHVDRRGNVRKGFLIDGSEKTPLKVAKPGQNEYLQPIRLSAAQRREFDLSNRVTVKAGTYRVSTMAFKSIKDERETIVVYQNNPRVKFRHVIGYTFIKDGSQYQKNTAIELVEQGRRR